MDVSFRFGLWFLVAIAVPSILIAVPLYLRHRVYSSLTLAVVSSDFRVIDEHVSTVWCSGIRLHMNTTFNVYLLRERPRFENATRLYTTEKRFNLKEGEQEFWGFFLPRGSTVTVAGCARFDGAKLDVVKGKRLMRKCLRPGYIDSDEELSEESSMEDEEESSFSSSEEAFNELHCMDTIFNQTFIPSIQCTADAWVAKDVISYTTPHTDYYYLVFSSTNSITRNSIFVTLMVNKVVYDVRSFLKKCFNSTKCEMPFTFASNEHVVLEVPDQSLWTADTIMSTCEPRTILYFPFYLGVPISILVFAFRGNK